MRILIALLVTGALLAGCNSADVSEIEYLVDGRAAQVDIAFLAPRGIPAETDTLVARGDSLYLRGDTTIVENVALPWKLFFEAESGQPLFLRAKNRTDRGHVSSIIIVDGDFRSSDGTAEAFGVAETKDKL